MFPLDGQRDAMIGKPIKLQDEQDSKSLTVIRDGIYDTINREFTRVLLTHSASEGALLWVALPYVDTDKHSIKGAEGEIARVEAAVGDLQCFRPEQIVKLMEGIAYVLMKRGMAGLAVRIDAMVREMTREVAQTAAVLKQGMNERFKGHDPEAN